MLFFNKWLSHCHFPSHHQTLSTEHWTEIRREEAMAQWISQPQKSSTARGKGQALPLDGSLFVLNSELWTLNCSEFLNFFDVSYLTQLRGSELFWGGSSCSMVANLQQNPSTRPVCATWLPALLKNGTMFLMHLNQGGVQEERWLLDIEARP